MQKHGVRNLIFSSSATVYGDPDSLPLKETAPLKRPTNAYGRTKFFIEEILRDLHQSDKTWSISLLRYT
jgi:UDP-glucose 4-epimerase